MKKYILVLLATLVANIGYAQKRHPKYDAYIEKFAKIAVEEQTKYGIPASITLAQGLLESGAGESRLAVQANNHFGIKCGDAWHGKKIYADDDAIGECFRSYKNPDESYEDHSVFLKRQRYAFLFDYDVTDYKAWAHGLKRAGYATDPKYPDKLIRIIETYKLNEYDTKANFVKEDETIISTDINGNIVESSDADGLFGYIKIKNNGLTCINLVEDDKLENIAKRFGIPLKMLLYFNDMYENKPLRRGDYVYLRWKKSKAEKGLNKHKVKVGESMHTISQDYGIRLKKLYQLNNMEYGKTVKAGTVLKLRK